MKQFTATGRRSWSFPSHRTRPSSRRSAGVLPTLQLRPFRPRHRPTTLTFNRFRIRAESKLRRRPRVPARATGRLQEPGTVTGSDAAMAPDLAPAMPRTLLEPEHPPMEGRWTLLPDFVK